MRSAIVIVTVISTILILSYFNNQPPADEVNASYVIDSTPSATITPEHVISFEVQRFYEANRNNLSPNTTSLDQLADTYPIIAKLPVTSAVASPDGKLLIIGTKTGKILIWSQNELLMVLTTHHAPIVYLEFRADGKALTSIDLEGRAYVWSIAAKPTF